MTPVLTRPQAPGEGTPWWHCELQICLSAFFFSIYLNGRSTSHKLRDDFHAPILKCGPETNTDSSLTEFTSTLVRLLPSPVCVIKSADQVTTEGLSGAPVF